MFLSYPSVGRCLRSSRNQYWNEHTFYTWMQDRPMWMDCLKQHYWLKVCIFNSERCCHITMLSSPFHLCARAGYLPPLRPPNSFSFKLWLYRVPGAFKLGLNKLKVHLDGRQGSLLTLATTVSFRRCSQASF